jgi:hypothetical protein
MLEIGDHEHSGLVPTEGCASQDRARVYKETRIYYVSLRVCSGPQQVLFVSRVPADCEILTQKSTFPIILLQPSIREFVGSGSSGDPISTFRLHGSTRY